MQHFINHIIFRSLAIFIAMTILVPSAVKLSHALEHQNHEVVQCLDHKSDAHLHEHHLDCEFYKFKLNSKVTLVQPGFEVLSVSNTHKVVDSQYDFISDYQRLHVSLRGPPQYS